MNNQIYIITKHKIKHTTGMKKSNIHIYYQPTFISRIKCRG